MSIADEVNKALVEAALEVAGSSFKLTFVRETKTAVWEQSAPLSFVVDALDSGIKLKTMEGSSDQTALRRITIASGAYEPKVGDKVTINGVTYSVVEIEPVSPFGSDIMYKVYVGR